MLFRSCLVSEWVWQPWCCSLTALLAFPLILSLGVGDGLPLHIIRRVWTTAGQGLDVVDYVARTLPARLAGGRAWVISLERMFCRCAAWLGGVRHKRQAHANCHGQISDCLGNSHNLFPFHAHTTRPCTVTAWLPSSTSTVFTVGLSLDISKVPSMRCRTVLMNNRSCALRT